MPGPYRVIEVVRETDDAMEYARQIHDMNNGDISLMANPDRALTLLYKHIVASQTAKKKVVKRKKNKA